MAAARSWRAWDLPSSQLFTGVAYGNGKFVAVAANPGGIDALAAVSSNGQHWQNHDMPRYQGYSSVAFGNDVFVAMPTGGGVPATSPDGITWTRGHISWPDAKVVFSNGLFVAVGPYGVAQVSTDGINYGLSYIPGDNPDADPAWTAVAAGNGRFVVASSLYPTVLSSSDGYSWTRTEFVSVGLETLGLVYGNGKFLAFHGTPWFDLSKQFVSASSDGVNWTVLTDQAPWRDMEWRYPTIAAVYAEGTFVVLIGQLPYNRGGPTRAYVSTDGASWSAVTLPDARSASFEALAYGRGTFVAIPSGGSHANVSGGAAKDYLRLNQRDDGLGVQRHPRLSGSNGPSSAQQGKPPRVGTGNRYR